jgi:hypothetical protein
MDRQAFVTECDVIEQNATYTAEAHHIIAGQAHGKNLLYKIIPAIVTALSSILNVLGVYPKVFAVLTIVAATVTLVGSVLDPEKERQSHLGAAKGFTILKQDARALGKVYISRMSDERLDEAVRNLHDRYNDLVRAVPPTNKKAFEEASARIKSGIHKPD